MAIPSTRYLARALFWLITTTTLYLLVNGAQIFETLLIVPAWTAAPPASLGMFQGQYALDFKAFWIAFHSLHEITFIVAVVFCWRLRPIRNWLLVLFVLHIAVRVWTVVYFAPTIIEFQRMAPSPAVDLTLVERAASWRNLNIARVVIFTALSLALIPLTVRVGKMLCEARKPAAGAST